jgi:hypothetical protein
MTSPNASRLSSDLSYVQSEQTIIHERTSLRLDLIVLLLSIGKLIKKHNYLIKKIPKPPERKHSCRGQD